ncbi:MAG: hypothetical protein ABIJ31_03435 [Pseudomonadota bacterium]
MKASKIVIFLIVIAVLGTGLYLIQDNKQNKDLVAHNKKQFQQITEVAKKNHSAGLLPMASALNKYYKIKGHYPKDLMELYPEFIPDKLFISTLNWEYYPQNKTYLIKRGIKANQTFASMGPDMKLKTGIEKTISPSEKIVLDDTPKTPQKSAALISSANKSDFKTDQVATVFSLNKTVKPTEIKPTDSTNTLKGLPELTIMKKELNRNETFLASFDRSNLYIWKTNEGVIGFSNIQYPDMKNLTIYKDKSWIKYQDNPNSSEPK